MEGAKKNSLQALLDYMELKSLSVQRAKIKQTIGKYLNSNRYEQRGEEIERRRSMHSY